METVALLIEAPEVSVINPERVAPVTCAATGVDKKRFRHRASARQLANATSVLILASIMIVSLASWLGSDCGRPARMGSLDVSTKNLDFGRGTVKCGAGISVGGDNLNQIHSPAQYLRYPIGSIFVSQALLLKTKTLRMALSYFDFHFLVEKDSDMIPWAAPPRLREYCPSAFLKWPRKLASCVNKVCD